MTHPLLAGLASALGQLATDRAAGRQALTELWDAIDPGDTAARCILPHYLADAQDDLGDEIAWDEVSLAESAKISDDDLRAIHPAMHVAGFMSSLHLNLADGYRRLGRFMRAAPGCPIGIVGASAQVNLGSKIVHIWRGRIDDILDSKWISCVSRTWFRHLIPF
jgi:hypothetical protein